MLKERAKIRRVEKAIKRSKKLEEKKKLEKLIGKEAEKIARKYSVSKEEAMAYVRAQMKREKRAERLKQARESFEQTRGILAKIAQGAEAFSAGAFVGQYEQPTQYQPKKSSKKSKSSKSKSRKTSQKTEPQYNTMGIGINTENILQYGRRIL